MIARTLRTLMVLCILPALGACGFKPMHAPNSFGATGISYSDISVQTVKEEKPDFLLKQALRDRLGDNSNTRYILTIDPTVSRSSLGISGQDVASRYDLTMRASFTLKERKTGNIVFKNNIIATSTFAAPRDAYGTISAQNNANEQVATEAADRILMRLARYKGGTGLSQKSGGSKK